MAEIDPIDWAQLKTRCMNDVEFVREMLAVFKTHASETYRKLSAALEANDLPTAKKHAHTLKGSAANLSAEPLRAASYLAETESKNGNLHAAVAAGVAVEAELKRALAVIERGPPQ